jgi:tetratricopeptide (TPR) repeat protein
MTDVFAIQDEICQAIVDQLRIDLVHDQPLIRQRTADVEAYNYCLKGRYHFIKLTPESLAKSKDYYERAIAIDPYYAIAWCRLARYYNMMGYLGFMPSKKAHELAFSAAMKAMELDELLPEAHAVAAVIKARDFNWIESERLFCRALELEPNSPDNWNSYSFFYLVPAGRLDEAVTASRKALELDPLSSFLQAELGHRLYLMKQYEEAIGSCRAAIELDPGEFTTYLFLGLSLLCLGRFDEAIDSCRRSVQLSERSPFTLAYLGLACAKANRIGEANKILAELLELADNRYVLPSCLGIMYLALGEMETGFRWFEKAVEEREGHILHLNTDPNSEPFRSHPYYKNLIRKMNMEP